MPSVYDRILELFYAKPVPIHEQRLACFKNLAAIQERVQKADGDKTIVTEYKAEYERCEPIMKMK
jgi:hypothetical protein